jgi:hypothetical protein
MPSKKEKRRGAGGGISSARQKRICARSLLVAMRYFYGEMEMIQHFPKKEKKHGEEDL